MATVHYESQCRDEFEDSDEFLRNPFAVADSDTSDVARAAADYSSPPISRSNTDCLPNRQQDRRIKSKAFHRIAEVREHQGITLRNVSRRLGVELSVVRRQEQSDCDMRLSELHRWQQVLDVPVAELLVEGDGQLSGPVLERARMVKLMKTAAAIRERTGGTPVGRMVTMLITQILEIMPELENVTPWPTVGQRRMLDDVGRTACNIMPDDVFRKPLP